MQIAGLSNSPIDNFLSQQMLFNEHLHHYFDRHVCLSICPSVCPSVRHKKFFSLKSPWNHPLTPGMTPEVDPAYPRARSPSEAGIF